MLRARPRWWAAMLRGVGNVRGEMMQRGSTRAWREVCCCCGPSTIAAGVPAEVLTVLRGAANSM